MIPALLKLLPSFTWDGSQLIAPGMIGVKSKFTLQGAVETIQKHDSGAAVVDSYKAMFKRMASERNALVERNVELEYQNQSLQSRVDAIQSREPIKKIHQPSDTSQVRIFYTKTDANLSLILGQNTQSFIKRLALIERKRSHRDLWIQFWRQYFWSCWDQLVCSTFEMRLSNELLESLKIKKWHTGCRSRMLGRRSLTSDLRSLVYRQNKLVLYNWTWRLCLKPAKHIPE